MKTTVIDAETQDCIVRWRQRRPSFIMAGLACACTCASVHAAAQQVSIANLSAEVQDNGKNVDISFDVSCEDPFQTNYVYIVARDSSAGMEYPVRTFEAGSESGPFTNGTYRMTWVATNDLYYGCSGDLTINVYATTAQLAHRWGFNGNCFDTAGTIDTTATGKVTLSGGAATLAGGTRGTSYITLGQEVFPGADQPRTIEIWARQNAVQNGSRIFDFGTSTSDFIFMGWTSGTSINSDALRVYGMGDIVGAMAPYEVGVNYHIAMTLNPLGDNVWNIRCYKQHNDTGETLSRHEFNATNVVSLTSLPPKTLFLGRSFFSGDNDASATYDEVRIWNAALSEEALSTNVIAGADSIGARASVDVSFDADVSFERRLWSYTLDASGNATVNGVAPATGDLVVPETIDGHPVVAIGASAFRNCTNMTSVVVPNSVASIGSAAFSGCSSLTNMVLPFVGGERGNSGSAALFGYIFGRTAYEGSQKVDQRYSSVGWGQSSESYVPCALKNLTITDETTLGMGAFDNCSMLANVVLPDSLATFDSYAFRNCTGLCSVAMGSGLTSVASSAFENCTSLSSVCISDLAAWLGITFGNAATART